MAQTRPTGEQLRFRSANTGEHVLDTYLEAAEKGGRSLTDLLDDVFDSTTGEFRTDNFEFRFDQTSENIQFRIGQFATSSAGWENLTSFFNHRGAYNSSNTYNHFDLVEVSNKDVYIVHNHNGAALTTNDEASFIAHAYTTKLIDVATGRDWAIKTDGIVDGTGYSAKAWSIGGTGVTDTASSGASKEWATKTSGTVDTAEYSAKEYAQGTQVGTGGSAKDWATETASNVDGVDYSAKEYAVGTQIRGTTGSAKDWAQYTGGTVDGTNYSAKYWATNTDVTTVSSNIADVSSVATNIADVNTVADDITNVNTVALAITDVSTVSSDIAAVITAANDLNEATSEIDTVANAIANVDIVGAGITNVNTVATNISNVNTVAGDTTEINALYADLTELNAVHTNLSGINTVANALGGTVTYTVTVSNNVFYIDGAANPVLTLKRGFTYVFDQSDSSNSSHPIAFQDGGSAYTAGITDTGTPGTDGSTTFVVPTNAPSNLTYICSSHGASYGNSINVTDDTFSAAVAISTDIVTVAANATDVSSVASAINDIQTVNTNTTDIQTVAGEIAPTNNVSTVAAVSSQVQTVAGQIAPTNNIATVAGVTSDISTVAGISGDVTTAAGSASDITAIVGEIAPTNNIATVAGVSTDISTVGGISADVTTVAGISANVTTVAGIDASVSSVANIAADVSGVATISGAVIGVNSNATDISTVAGQISPTNNVATVAGVATDVSTVSGVSANVTTVAGVASDVTTVAGISSDVTTVAGISSDVTTVAANDANVTTVANNIADAVTFVERYRVDTTDPTTSLDAGDLFFNTTSNTLKVYNGTAWDQPYYSTSGGTITGNVSITGSATVGVTLNVNGTANINDLDNVQTGDIAALTVGTLTQGSTWSAPYSDAKRTASLRLNAVDPRNSIGVKPDMSLYGPIYWALNPLDNENDQFYHFSDYSGQSYTFVPPNAPSLIVNNNDLTQSTWTKSDMGVSKSTTVTSPLEGTIYADALTPSSAMGAAPEITVGLPTGDYSSQYLYFSCWAKPNGYEQLEFRLMNTSYTTGSEENDLSSDSYHNYARINLTDGQNALDGSSSLVYSYARPDGWRRVVARLRFASPGRRTLRIRVGTGTGTSWNFGVAGNGASGIYVSNVKGAMREFIPGSSASIATDGTSSNYTAENSKYDRMTYSNDMEGSVTLGRFVDPLSKKYGCTVYDYTRNYQNQSINWQPETRTGIDYTLTSYGQKHHYSTMVVSSTSSYPRLVSSDTFSLGSNYDEGLAFTYIIMPGDLKRMAFGSDDQFFNTYDFSTKTWLNPSNGSGGVYYFAQELGAEVFYIHVGFDYNKLLAAGSSSYTQIILKAAAIPLGPTDNVDFTYGISSGSLSVTSTVSIGAAFGLGPHRVFLSNSGQHAASVAAFPQVWWPYQSNSADSHKNESLSFRNKFTEQFQRQTCSGYSAKGALYLTYNLPNSQADCDYDRMLLTDHRGAGTGNSFFIMRRNGVYGAVYLTDIQGAPMRSSSDSYLFQTTSNTNIPDEFQIVINWDNTTSGGLVTCYFGNGDSVSQTGYLGMSHLYNQLNSITGNYLYAGFYTSSTNLPAAFPVPLNLYANGITSGSEFKPNGIFTGMEIYDQPLTEAHATKLFNDYRNSGI